MGISDQISGGRSQRGRKPPISVKNPLSSSTRTIGALSGDVKLNGSSNPPPQEWMRSVLKVFCTHNVPNLSTPWQKKLHRTTSSGFMIEGHKVLTNAHSIQNYAEIKLKKCGSDAKYKATVLAIGAECDIANNMAALLEVKDEEFWEGVSPVKFGDLPALKDTVNVVGYPIEGETVSWTQGVVSRIEPYHYIHGSTELLALQTDAAINPGNSGGPVFNDKDQCVAIAFQSTNDAQNIGHAIPVTVVSHFLLDYEKNEKYTGFPLLGIEWQKMENPALREHKGMKPEQKGVLITGIDPAYRRLKVLEQHDVILSLDGIEIANDGTVPFRTGERIVFSHLISEKYAGDTVRIEILRNSGTERTRKTEVLHFDIRLYSRLVPSYVQGWPPYYIVGGFVFTVLSIPYLIQLEPSKVPANLMNKHSVAMRKCKERQYVVVCQVLPADINSDYESIVNIPVIDFNGQSVMNLKELANMVEHCKYKMLTFTFEDGQMAVLPTKAAKKATAYILTSHCIPSAMSVGL